MKLKTHILDIMRLFYKNQLKKSYYFTKIYLAISEFKRAPINSPLSHIFPFFSILSDSPFRTAISGAILKLQEEGKLHILKTRWWKEKKGGGKCRVSLSIVYFKGLCQRVSKTFNRCNSRGDIWRLIKFKWPRYHTVLRLLINRVHSAQFSILARLK